MLDTEEKVHVFANLYIHHWWKHKSWELERRSEASVGKSNHFHVCTNVVRRRDQHFFIASYVRAGIMALTDAEKYTFLALLAKQQH